MISGLNDSIFVCRIFLKVENDWPHKGPSVIHSAKPVSKHPPRSRCQANGVDLASLGLLGGRADRWAERVQPGKRLAPDLFCSSDRKGTLLNTYELHETREKDSDTSQGVATAF